MPIFADEPILFLSQRIPFPPDKGDKLRSFNFLRFLAERGPVHLGCFVDDPEDWRRAGELKRMVAESCLIPLDRGRAALRSLSGFITGEALNLPYYHDRRMTRWAARVLMERRPKLAFLFSSQMAQYLPASARPPVVVMDFCDVDSQKWRQYAERRRPPMRWLYRREGDRLLAFERKVARSADASLFVSPAERDLFLSLAPESEPRIHAIENGIDADLISPDRSYQRPFNGDGPAAVFTGAMDYRPNIEAVLWFVAEVLPLLRRHDPSWRLMIVGSNPAPAVLALAGQPGVTVTGRVVDTRPYLAHASVVVAPLRTARGVQNKVLEGMAMARPVVATPEAHEGLDAEAGCHLLVADGPQSFAKAVLEAARPESASMAVAGRRRVVERYGWQSRFTQLERLLETLAQ